MLATSADSVPAGEPALITDLTPAGVRAILDDIDRRVRAPADRLTGAPAGAPTTQEDL